MFSFAYCLKEQVLGVGWQVPTRSKTLSWEAYEKAAGKTYGGLGAISRVRYLHDHVKSKDLIWTRDTRGSYYLAKVLGTRNQRSDIPWLYLDTPEGRHADIVNVVRCRILAVPLADDVTGKIVACFRPSRVIQPIRDETTILYSQLLWNQMTGSEEYKLPQLERCDVFSFIDAETTEDVIFIYLQYKGWIVVPNSRKADTMGYEFVAIHKKTLERAVVQVKSGHTHLAADGWGDSAEKVFLFQTHRLYTGIPSPNVTLIEPSTIEKFMTSQIAIMPNAVKRWVDFAAKLNARSR